MKEILIPLNFTTTPTVYDTKQSFSTSDEASGVLTFTTTADVAGTVASLTIRNASENANRQTVLIERLDVNSSPFSYALKNPLPFGQYEGTVLLKKNLTVIASASFLFGVNSSLSAEVLPDLVKEYSLDELVENVETEVSNLKDAFHLTVSETVKGVNKTESSLQAQENVRYLNEHQRKANELERIANENARISAEVERKDTFDTLVESEVIEQTVAQEVAEKYQEIEALNTTEMVSFRKQLADKVGAGVKAEPEDLSATTLGLVTGTGGPINLLSVPQADSVTRDKLGADLKNKIFQIFERLKSLALSVGGNVPTVNLIGNILTGQTIAMSQYFTLDTSNQGTFVSGRKYKVVIKYNNQSAFNAHFDVCSFVYSFKDGIAFGAIAPALTTTGFEFDYTAVKGGDLSIIMYGDGVRDFVISAFVYDITDIDTAITDNLDFLALGTSDEIIIKSDYVRVAETAKEIAQSNDITCFGDSLTEGAGGGGTTYPIVLASLSGRTVRNMGIGGESTVEISARQGGVPAIVNPFTIPASGAVAITLQNSTIGHQGNFAGINTCKINGIEGMLTWNGSTLLFNRFVDGSSVEVTHPTALQTFAMQHYRDDIVVIYMGTNGGWQKTTSEGDINLLKSQINRMINYLTSINKRYIVVGLHYYQAWFNATREEIESAMVEEYGRNYINIRDYIVNYGLQDAGLTATSEDTAALALGNVPPGLLSDTIHYNAHGYTIIGNQIYKRMVELGIL